VAPYWGRSVAKANALDVGDGRKKGNYANNLLRPKVFSSTKIKREGSMSQFPHAEKPV